MGRSSNDDRSDSMNPNNDAYWASESNRDNQLGGDDEEFVKPYRSRGVPPQPESRYCTYAIAILTYEGKACFLRFATVETSVPNYTKPSPLQVAKSVWDLSLRWMSEISNLGIAYARIWGPGMTYLPKVIWSAPDGTEAYWNAPERQIERRFGGQNEVAKARAWFTVVERARRYEHVLEMLDFTGSEDLGVLNQLIDYDKPNPLLDLMP